MTTDAGERGPLSDTDRAAAFAAGAPKMSRKVIYLAIAAILVLGVGGTIADRFVTSGSAPSQPVTRGGSLPTRGAAPSESAALHAPLPAFMDLSSMKGHPAPAFTLHNAATGAPVSLSSLHGHVVVLTFANAACNDICPVLLSELAQARRLLGATRVPVTFVTIDSDPLATTRAAASRILAASRAESPPLSGWQFLTTRLSVLDPIWVDYGIAITADRTTRTATHNNLMYFVGPDGTLQWSATPFADESSAGAYTLPAADVARFAQGIAHYADQLAGTP